VRCAKLGLDHGLKGALIGPSSYFKKSPPYQFPDDICKQLTESFIRDPKGSEQRVRAQIATNARAPRAAAARNGRPSANGRGASAKVAAKRRRRAKTAAR